MVRAKVAASAFARGYLNGIVKSVFQQLQDTGYFYDPVEREVSARTCRSTGYKLLALSSGYSMLLSSRGSCPNTVPLPPSGQIIGICTKSHVRVITSSKCDRPMTQASQNQYLQPCNGRACSLYKLSHTALDELANERTCNMRQITLNPNGLLH